MGSIILAFVFLQCADAAYPPIYDVEIIVFLNNNADAGGEKLRTLKSGNKNSFERAFPEGEFTELSYQFYQLKNITASLERSKDYNVLFHRAWRQLAYNRDNAIPYPLDSLVNGDNKSVAGSIKLVRERYLHLDIDVQLISSSAGKAAGNHPIFQLREKRRIKSNQIHYFDHPYLSVIAKVTPYKKNGNGNSNKSETVSFLEKKFSIK